MSVYAVLTLVRPRVVQASPYTGLIALWWLEDCDGEAVCSRQAVDERGKTIRWRRCNREIVPSLSVPGHAANCSWILGDLARGAWLNPGKKGTRFHPSTAWNPGLPNIIGRIESHRERVL